VSLKTARDYRAEARALLAIGVDPQKHREQASAAARIALEQTFQQIALTWFDVKKTEVTDDYADDIWRSLELHVFPSVGPSNKKADWRPSNGYVSVSMRS
jgi:tyrosyl-tRNA synthetase